MELSLELPLELSIELLPLPLELLESPLELRESKEESNEAIPPFKTLVMDW